MKKIHFFIIFINKVIRRYFKVELKAAEAKIIPNQNIYTPKKKAIPNWLNKSHSTLLIIIVSLFIIGWFIKYSQPDQNSLSVGLIGVYTNKNLPPLVTNLISKPLFDLNSQGQAQPKLLKNWEMNQNATVYTLTLSDNLFWQDGTEVNSSDIIFSLEDVEVSYPDKKTIVFKLADSFNPFPARLTNPVIKNNSLIGLGDYKISNIEYSSANNNFITELNLFPVDIKSNYPNLVIRFYPDESTAKSAYELGEVDSLIGVNNHQDLVNPLTRLEQFTNYSKIVAIFLNTQDKMLSDKNLRKALSYATPKIKSYDFAKTSIPVSSWVYNESLKESIDNFDEAKKYYQKVKTDQEVITLTTTPNLEIVGQEIIQAWEKLGAKVVLKVENGVSQNFQALLITQTIPFDPDQYALWHSTQTKTNLSQYSFARMDKELEDGRKTADLSLRKEKYLNMQKILSDDNPAVFLYFPKVSIIYRTRVQKSLGQIFPLLKLSNY